MRALGVVFIAGAVLIIRWVGRGHGWWGPEANGAQTPNQAPTGTSGVGTLPPNTPPGLLPGSPTSPLPMPPPSSDGNSQWGAVFPA